MIDGTIYAPNSLLQFHSHEAEREHNSFVSRIHYMQAPSIPLDPTTL
jgi:hypothetical protein